MSLIRWDPWGELENLHSEVDRLWNAFIDKINAEHERDYGPIGFIPEVDVVDTDRELRVFVSLPGLVEEDIDLLLQDDRSLVIRGERVAPYDASARSRISRHGEWRYGYFERRLQLPLTVRPDSLRAEYDAGVLTIIVAKTP